MKKIFKILICFLVIIIIGITFKLLYPSFRKTYEFDDLNISFKCPIYYERLETVNDEIIFKSNRNGIKIATYKFNKNFLSKDSIAQKMEEYKSILAAKNYDCVLENTSTENVQVSGIESGKITIEIKSINQLNKEVTLIIPTEEHDLIFSIYGTNEQMIKCEKQIEKILKSVKVK